MRQNRNGEEMATTALPDVPVRTDSEILQDAYAETKACDNIAVIADELDLEHRRIVATIELRRIARKNGADLRDDEIKSFLRSGIIAETTDAQGETTYVAVEASSTADVQDANRVQRHAAVMQRLTRKPCRAVIASVRNNERLVELIERNEVAWHQLYIRIEPAG